MCYSAGVMVLSRGIRGDSLSLREAGIDAGLPQRTPRDHRQRRVPHRHRPARRSRLPDRFDVYYGMADSRIGVARLDVPDFLPPEQSPTRRKQRCNAPDLERRVYRAISRRKATVTCIGRAVRRQQRRIVIMKSNTVNPRLRRRNQDPSPSPRTI